MSYAEVEERPAKKRRFFVDHAEETCLESRPVKSNEHEGVAELDDCAEPSPIRNAAESERVGQTTLPSDEAHTQTEPGDTQAEGFSADSLKGIIGEKLPPAAIHTLRKLSNNNLEQAINVYFDGSWRTSSNVISQNDLLQQQGRANLRVGQHESPLNKVSTAPESDVPVASSMPQICQATPHKRYIGAFGATAWATTSGAGLISYGERITLERIIPLQSARKSGKLGRMARQDIVVRFKNSRRQEVGRLETEAAVWISSLMDQKICKLEGRCVYAPERLRTSDTVYLQLRCYLLRDVFQSASTIKPLDDNRQTNLFEAKESDEERVLRLRQVALVRLFEEIKLNPTRINAQAEKNRRQGLLQAAEATEKQAQTTFNQRSKNIENGGSSPPSEEEEGKELEQDQLDSLYKKAQSFDFETPQAEPAETFNLSLRKYQRQALYWMLQKEKNDSASHKQQSIHPLWEEYVWPTKDADDQDVPEVAGQTNFYVNPYSGEMSLDFPIQEQNCLGGILADEMGLGKTIEMLSLIHSNKSVIEPFDHDCEPYPQRISKNLSLVEHAPATTLVIAPMSLLAQWQSEAEKASKPGTLKTMMYYGTEKNANLREICRSANAGTVPNIIITSYGVVLSEYNQVASSGEIRGSSGGLFSLEYFRIILDEAHFIKNRQSKTAKACYELKALHRWVLTGTPIVNRLEDLFSLVHFLRVEPWSNFSFWKTFITVPFESKDFIRALDVVQTVLEPLVLRRTKDMKTPDGEALVPLPPKTIDVQYIELSKAEREVYDYVLARAKRTFAQHEENPMKAYTTIFAQILRLRQTCCHPILTRNRSIVADELEASNASDLANGLADDMDLDVLLRAFEAEEQDANRYGTLVLKQIQEEANQECPICAEEPMVQQSVTGCWHSACKGCLLEYIEHQASKGDLPRCFNCREPVTRHDVFEVVRHEDDDASMLATPRISLRRTSAESSAKIASLITHLKTLRKENSSMKSVVFSQFTSFLDLIEPALSRENIAFLRFDGSISQKQRALILNDFTTSNEGIVLLLSLRAGGVGLNLTTAKRVFMMDPWWSFAVEAQAIDRVHRMGQEDEVKVIRFIASPSIEEKMLRIQERKKFIASSLGMMSDEEKKLQRIEDIKELLS